MPAVKVNTVGYERSWRKIAIFNVDPTGAVVKDASSGRVVLAIQPEPAPGRVHDRSRPSPPDLVSLERMRFSSSREA